MTCFPVFWTGLTQQDMIVILTSAPNAVAASTLSYVVDFAGHGDMSCGISSYANGVVST